MQNMLDRLIEDILELETIKDEEQRSWHLRVLIIDLKRLWIDGYNHGASSLNRQEEVEKLPSDSRHRRNQP